MNPVLQSTQDALGAKFAHADSRALLLTRYAQPELKADERTNYLSAVVKASRHDTGLLSWRQWVASLRSDFGHLVFGRLEARLLINMAGSVMENAGLQLDRFGVPFIPGSAVKGCARRAALAALRDWCETDQKPLGIDQPFTLACETFPTAGAMLVAIYHVFGCTDLEWLEHDPDTKELNDLAWACAGQWPALRTHALAALRVAFTEEDALPNLRGAVAFLPAYPWDAPKEDLELDVLTCHHPLYYRGTQTSASDTESPNPVAFPAVAAGAVYGFPVLPLSSAYASFAEHARRWLAVGLSTFGLGAKTAAGYGWFEIDETSNVHRKKLVAAAAARRADAARGSLQPDDEIIAQLAALREDSLRGRLNHYANEPRFWPAGEDENTQLSLLHFVTAVQPALWQKEKANPKSKVTKAIVALAAKFNHPLS
jgi:CRISPR-associated protein Cmr6